MHATIHTARLFALIEQLVDVNRYVVDGTHLWALFRTTMHFPLQRVFAPANVPQDVGDRLRAAFEARCATRTVLPASGEAGMLDGMGDGPIVMVAGGPTHSRVIDGLYVSPIADAWTERFDAAGHRVLKVDVLPEWLAQHQPRRHPSVAVAQPVETERQQRWAGARDRWLSQLVALFEEINAALAPVVGFTLDLDESVPMAFARFVAERETAGRWLDRVRPGAVCFVCYYETCYLPVVSACRLRGIPTIELQHGMNGSMHPAYSHWTALPEQGYDVLPSVFATWGEASSRNLRRWWPTGQRGHRTVIGGRPRVQESAAQGAMSAGLHEVITQAARRVVITMQDKPLTTRQLAEMRACPTDWLWLIRAHPNAARFPAGSEQAVTQQLRDAGIGNAVVASPAMATLDALFGVADAHLTHHSSSWMEAATFGVPTVFTLPGADQLFEYELQDGLAIYAPDGVGMRAVIEAGRGALTIARERVIAPERAIV